jgi:hypothetical protein
MLKTKVMENSNKKLDQTKKKSEDLINALDSMLENNQDSNLDCSSGVCIIKGDKSIVERINKKIITEDGRQLLF